MRLHLIRHPKPMVDLGLCYGQTDLGVASEDIAQSTSALLSRLPAPAILYCSPLQRCADLADALSQAGGYAPAQRDPNLMEMHFGTWEMRSWQGIGRQEIDAWADDMVHYRPGDGESVYDMGQRVLNFCASVRQVRHDDVVVVCHAGTIRLLQAWRPGIDAARLAHDAASKPHAIGYGEICMIEIPSIVCGPDAQRL